MLYRDLVQFEPIETVIKLRDTDEKGKARELVRTYVISERMADRLANVVIPQLQFQTPHDNKGVLIVGNYGTGKSHLMAMLSAIAEHADLVSELSHKRVAEAAQAIAGRFKVRRVEIGASTRSLRDILLDELEEALALWGTPFSFPAADQVTNNKDPLIQAVAGFRARYPEQGILLVVDELLDYLRSREERQLILDLGFLRELGEVASATPFRLIGGLQETLFDSPRFAFVASQLRRVRDRFEQVSIVREDIAHVVSHRLLAKEDRQLAWIAEHLRQFAPLYSGLVERLEEFAALFPIHPAYIETFERVFIAEKREVLSTFSRAIKGLLDKPVPEEQPGLISYDHYWDVLREDPSTRSIPEVAEVIEKSNVLQGLVASSYTRPHLLSMAQRIIRALSVQRLTTGDINLPLGVTAEALRDELCLHMRLPEPSADFLLDQVQVALNEIIRTVQGQFISHNEANGQYYIDVKKSVDFDAKIKVRGEMLSHDDLNRYFFDALSQAMSLSETTYVTNFRIWFYELPWEAHGVTRPGYLFLGAPNERSTAQPPRDFYVYFLPPFGSLQWHDEERSDEVILALTETGEGFERIVRNYAGARDMAITSAQYRTQYNEKADIYLRELTRWFRDHLAQHLKITYQGVTQPVAEVLAQARSTASRGIADLVRLVAARLLETEFGERYPGYPRFTGLPQPISEEARAASALEAVRALAGGRLTNLARVVLQGLELCDAEGKVRPYTSRYATSFLERLQQQPEGHVVNRGELITQVAGGIQPIEKDPTFALEPEWVAVALLALVYDGDIELSLSGTEALNAGNIERAALNSMDKLTDFRFYKRPPTLPVGLWSEILEVLGLAPGLVRDENTREEAVRELQRVVNAETSRVTELEDRVKRGITLWNAPLFTDSFAVRVEQGLVVGRELPEVTFQQLDVLPHLRQCKRFLEQLTPFNTVGKLRNLRLSPTEVAETRRSRAALENLEALLHQVDHIQPLTTYLAEAQASLPKEHPWAERAAAERQELLATLRRVGRGEGKIQGAELARQLERLKREYIAAYTELHRRTVLGPAADERRVRIYHSARLQAARQLTGLELLPSAELDRWNKAISALQPCPQFHEGLLEDSPVCPHCHLRPAQQDLGQDAEKLLGQLDEQLDALLLRWRQALRSALQSDTAQSSLTAMTGPERRPIEAFLAQSEGEAALPEGFVGVASQALRGIQALAIAPEALLEALKAGGLPCTVEDFQARFARFLQEVMRGHDVRNTRVVF